MLPRNVTKSVIFRGRVIHGSHTLGYRANTLFCWRCGAKAEKRVKTLSQPCHEPNFYTMRDFKAWLATKPPEPIFANSTFPATLLTHLNEEEL